MGTYSSYRLYQKYQIIGNQDPVPVIPLTYSVSGDSLDPQPLVIKLENDPQCGYVPPVEYQYRDIESGYTCVDFDKYTKIVRQRSSDGINWENVSYSAGTLIEHNSTDCGYVGELYRWVNSGTTCYQGNKYIRIIQQVSYDGINWTNTGQEARGTMIESDSPDCIEYRWVNMDISTDWICDECPELEYRWIATTGYVCSGTNKMTKEIEQVSYDSGATWQNVVPEVSRAALPVIEYDSQDCGYIPPQYRTLTTATTCIGYDKYVLEEYQVSYDSGSTWTTTGTSATTLIEADSTDCGYIPHDYSKDYLTFIPISGSSTFKFSGNTVEYSVDSGSTWTSMASGGAVTVGQGNKIYWKASGLGAGLSGIGKFSSTGKFIVEGNSMSLVSGDSYESATAIIKNQFRTLFYGCSGLTSAENLILPARTLTEHCYERMFLGCTSLTTAPQLPATTLANYCYSSMFSGCTNLTTAPELPATTLASNCYYGMFQGCTSLTTAPQLPATTLTQNCYHSMFQGCTSLTTAPTLSATTLAGSCYYSMFKGCTSLTSAPELPATTLAEFCYSEMFSGCTSLTTAPELPATTLANYCYYRLLSNCPNINNITCLATNISATDCTTEWVYNVASSGTFTKASSMTGWTSDYTGNGIPYGWTVQNYSS